MSEEPFRERVRTLSEYVQEAITDAGDTEEYATPESALAWTLELAWGTLASSRHSAANGVWSVGCASAVTNIVGLTRLLGPISWEKVAWTLLADGLYEQIHETIGTPTPLTYEQRNWYQNRKEDSR